MNPARRVELDDAEVRKLLNLTYELQHAVLDGRVSLQGFEAVNRRLLEGDIFPYEPPSGFFVSLPDQIQNFYRWNHEYGWGFTPKQIGEAYDIAASISWPSGYLQAPVLVPTLETPQSTYGALVELSLAKHPGYWIDPNVTPEEVQSNPGRIALAEGIEFKPHTLQWHIIDLAAHWNGPDTYVAPQNVCGPDSAHAEILAAAAHFPDWIKAMDGERVPFVWLIGYRVRADTPEAIKDGEAVAANKKTAPSHDYSLKLIYGGQETQGKSINLSTGVIDIPYNMAVPTSRAL